MANYIYIHHKGQFFHMNKPPKIQTALGQKLFVNANHDLIYSLESSDKKHGQNCSYIHNNDLDKCITMVSVYRLCIPK